jgi:hypothetical protein
MGGTAEQAASNELARREKLMALAENWLRIARRKFVDAETESYPAGKRLIEHGALCYLNCAEELKAALHASAPQVSATRLAR